jgi:hypothetical protein
MIETTPQRPCQLHKAYRLNIECLQEHEIKIHNQDEDLVDKLDRTIRDASGSTIWEEKAIGLVCEACYKSGRSAYMECLETSVRGKLLVSGTR